MNQERLRLLYKLGILLLLFVILYCFLLLKPLWKPIFKAIAIAVFPFIIGGFIAFLLHPLVEKLESLGIKRGFAIFAIYLIFFGGTGYAFYLGIPILIDQARHFSEHLPELVGHYKALIQNLHTSTSRWPDGLQKQMIERINDFELALNKFTEKTVSIVMEIVNYLFILAVIPFISFYLLKDLDDVKKTVWYLTPKKFRQNGIEFLSAVNNSLGGYIRGQFLVCFIMGVLASIGFWLIKLQYPVILGGIIAVTNIIPYFGPVIGAVPVLAIALLSSAKQAIFALVIVFSLQMVEGNFLSPYIVGKSLNMHPLFIIAALIIGGEAGGIIGMIVAVPLLAVLKVAIIHTRDYLISTNQS